MLLRYGKPSVTDINYMYNEDIVKELLEIIELRTKGLTAENMIHSYYYLIDELTNKIELLEHHIENTRNGF